MKCLPKITEEFFWVYIEKYNNLSLHFALMEMSFAWDEKYGNKGFPPTYREVVHEIALNGHLQQLFLLMR